MVELGFDNYQYIHAKCGKVWDEPPEGWKISLTSSRFLGGSAKGKAWDIPSVSYVRCPTQPHSHSLLSLEIEKRDNNESS